MTFFTLLIAVSILGALMGVKRPWMGGIAGLLITPLLFFSNISQNVTALMISALALILLSAAYGFMSFIIVSGLKGGGHNVGQTYISGFGAHHPGGIILSDEEINMIADNSIKQVGILAY